MIKDIKVDYVEDDITNFFKRKLEGYVSNSAIFYDKTQTMIGDYFGTTNILPYADNEMFTYLDRIKNKTEEVSSILLDYHYVHLLDYGSGSCPLDNKGGKMLAHNHAFIEDYTSLLYLNDCDDGATFFINEGEECEILPEKNKLVAYPAHLDHGSRYTISKKIVVFGFHFKYRFILT